MQRAVMRPINGPMVLVPVDLSDDGANFLNLDFDYNFMFSIIFQVFPIFLYLHDYQLSCHYTQQQNLQFIILTIKFFLYFFTQLLKTA
jgi:hypothetical protein